MSRRRRSPIGLACALALFALTTFASTVPYLGAPIDVPGLVEAEHYDTAGTSLSYHDTTAANIPGQLRTSESVDIDATTDVGGGYQVTWTAEGEWMTYTVNVTTSSLYDVILRVANWESAGATLHLEMDGVDITGPIEMIRTGGWQKWREIEIPAIALTEGVQELKVVFDDDHGNYGMGSINYFKFELVTTSPGEPEPPEVMIIDPTEGSRHGSDASVHVEVGAFDDSRVAAVELFVDGLSVGQNTEAPYVWYVNDLTPGSHSLYATAIDDEGLMATSDLVNIDVDLSCSDLLAIDDGTIERYDYNPPHVSVNTTNTHTFISSDDGGVHLPSRYFYAAYEFDLSGASITNPVLRLHAKSLTGSVEDVPNMTRLVVTPGVADGMVMSNDIDGVRGAGIEVDVHLPVNQGDSIYLPLGGDGYVLGGSNASFVIAHAVTNRYSSLGWFGASESTGLCTAAILSGDKLFARPPRLQMYPANGTIFSGCDPVRIHADVSDAFTFAPSLDVYVDGVLVRSQTSEELYDAYFHVGADDPYFYEWTTPHPGAHTVTCVVTDEHGNASTGTVFFTVSLPEHMQDAIADEAMARRAIPDVGLIAWTFDHAKGLAADVQASNETDWGIYEFDLAHVATGSVVRFPVDFAYASDSSTSVQCTVWVKQGDGVADWSDVVTLPGGSTAPDDTSVFLPTLVPMGEVSVPLPFNGVDAFSPSILTSYLLSAKSNGWSYATIVVQVEQPGKSLVFTEAAADTKCPVSLVDGSAADEISSLPVISIANPTEGAVLGACNLTDVGVSLAFTDGVASVAYYVNGEFLEAVTSWPFASTWSPPHEGVHILMATVADGEGQWRGSDNVSVTAVDHGPGVIMAVEDWYVFHSYEGDVTNVTSSTYLRTSESYYHYYGTDWSTAYYAFDLQGRAITNPVLRLHVKSAYLDNYNETSDIYISGLGYDSYRKFSAKDGIGYGDYIYLPLGPYGYVLETANPTSHVTLGVDVSWDLTSITLGSLRSPDLCTAAIIPGDEFANEPPVINFVTSNGTVFSGCAYVELEMQIDDDMPYPPAYEVLVDGVVQEASEGGWPNPSYQGVYYTNLLAFLPHLRPGTRDITVVATDYFGSRASNSIGIVVDADPGIHDSVYHDAVAKRNVSTTGGDTVWTLAEGATLYSSHQPSTQTTWGIYEFALENVMSNTTVRLPIDLSVPYDGSTSVEITVWAKQGDGVAGWSDIVTLTGGSNAPDNASVFSPDLTYIDDVQLPRIGSSDPNLDLDLTENMIQYLQSAKTSGWSYVAVVVQFAETNKSLRIVGSSDEQRCPAMLVEHVFSNTPPTIAITQPQDGAVYTNGMGSVPVVASVTDDVTVNPQLDIYHESTLIHTIHPTVDTVLNCACNPYTWQWSNAPTGDHTLVFEATDGQGAVTTARVAIVVSPNYAFIPDTNNLIVVEAEHYTVNTPRGAHYWREEFRYGNSGWTAMKALPNGGANVHPRQYFLSPSLDYQVAFPTAGRYYIWLRGHGYSDRDDSCHFGLDGVIHTNSDFVGMFSPYDPWTWSSYDLAGDRIWIDVPSAGIHALGLWMREDGFIADKIILTMDPNYVPTDLGPDESPTYEGPIDDSPQSDPPSVAVTFPSNGSVLGADEPFTLAAEASDDEFVSVVRFYRNGTIYGTFYQPPYDAHIGQGWHAGVYDLVAVATDNEGQSTTSSVAHVIVREPCDGETAVADGVVSAYYLPVVGTNAWTLETTSTSVRISHFTGNFHYTPWGIYEFDVSTLSQTDRVLALTLTQSPAAYVGSNVSVKIWGKQGNGAVEWTDAVLLPAGSSVPDDTSTTHPDLQLLDVLSFDENMTTGDVVQSSLAVGAFINSAVSSGWSHATIVLTVGGSDMTMNFATEDHPQLCTASLLPVEVVTPFEQNPFSHMVVMEGENHHRRVDTTSHAWETISAAGASASHALKALPNIGANVHSKNILFTPYVDYDINFAVGGTHYIWVRGLGANAWDDSCHLGLNGVVQPHSDFVGMFEPFNTWRWSNSDLAGTPVTVDVPGPGIHTLNLWMREDGFQVDKILVTTDSTYVPTSLGPPESQLIPIIVSGFAPEGDGDVDAADVAPGDDVAEDLAGAARDVRLQSVTRDGRDGVRLSLETEPGQTYILQGTTNLSSGDWFDISKPIRGDGFLKEFDASERPDSYFYRGQVIINP